MSEAQPVRVVHYINQFFGGIGGEEKAGTPPHSVEGSVGPGRLLEMSSKGKIKVIGTVICGDNYFVENEGALDEIVKLIEQFQPEGVLAGPAFSAGRYGEASAAVCQAVQDRLGIPVITGLGPDSTALETYRRYIPIVRTGTSAVDMKNSMPVMGTILVKMVRGEELTAEDQEKLYKRGLKKNVLKEKNAAERAIDMLLAKYRGEPYQTELPMTKRETVPPAPPAQSGPIRLALVTDGGLILKGNPEGMAGGRSKRFCRIDIKDWSSLSADDVDVNHFGYDTRYVAENPNRLVPLDAVRLFEQAGEITLHPILYSTAGVATAIEDAARMGREIAQELIDAGVQAVILTST
jgi:glycine reductase